MTSDRARVTYDPSRRYHGVVAQQGRVWLEADWNEAQAISREQTETRTLDLVGRAGSPDHGYRIDPVVTHEGSASGDLRIHRGTAYAGGQRVSLGDDILYSSQPDWQDHAADPLWLDPAIPDQRHELVYLMLREQEISAVEDPALRDIALGGPDTSQRIRILQRIIRYPTAAPTWEDAWAQVIGQRWSATGFRLDHPSGRLEAYARLQVIGDPDGSDEQPVDDGTYLGPDNQLIRVQISRLDDDGVPCLVWGYDNASFMYRLSGVSAGAASGTTALQLATAPVDAYHQPQEKQAVEVLRSAASLTRDDFAAAATGEVAAVTEAYDPDTRTVVIGKELPPGYDPAQGPLFLRVWNEEFTCKPGEDHELGDTGIRIRLTAPEHTAPGGFPAGCYWMIAVRPAVGPRSAGVVYPRRIMDAPQPPDGPRMWLTPLAFVRWHAREPAAEDCLPRFDSLAGQEHSGGSCTVRIGPQDVGGGWALQDAIDAHATGAHPTIICLEPGSYALRRPLRIGPQHGRLTLRAERRGVVLHAERETAARFVLGLIAAEGTDGLSLQDLEIRPAQVPFELGPDVYFHLPQRARELLAAHRHRRIAIGVHASHCTNLSVEGCRFVLPMPASPAPGGQAPGGPAAPRPPGSTRTCSPWPSSARRRYRVCGSSAAPSPPASTSNMRVTTAALVRAPTAAMTWLWASRTSRPRWLRRTPMRGLPHRRRPRPRNQSLSRPRRKGPGLSRPRRKAPGQAVSHMVPYPSRSWTTWCSTAMCSSASPLRPWPSASSARCGSSATACGSAMPASGSSPSTPATS